LLQERRNLFSRGTYDKRRTKLVQHSIDTRQYDDNRQLVTSVSEDGNQQRALAAVGDDITAAGDEDRTTDPVDTMVRVGDVPAKIKGDVNGGDVHVGCYPGSSTCGEDVNGTRGRGNDKGEDGGDTLVEDGRVGPGDIRNDATGHGKAGDGVLVGGDSVDGSVVEGPRSYTFGPNIAPDRPRRYTFGQAADVYMLPDEGKVRRRCNEDNGMDTGRSLNDKTAIAGDPMSAVPTISRPKRDRQRPLRYRDA